MEPEPEPSPLGNPYGVPPTAEVIRDLLGLSCLAQQRADSLLPAAAAGGSAAAPDPAQFELHAAEDAEPAKGIKVEKLEGWRGRKPPVIRCTTTIPASVPRELWPALMDVLALRQVWDDACALTHRVASFEADALASGRSINRTQTKPVPTPYSTRTYNYATYA